MEELKQYFPFSPDTDSESLTQEVYRTLLNRFLISDYVPGKILNRKELAEELNVSIAPVSSALQQLTAEGFIETIPRKGTIVRAVDRDDVWGSLVLREAIETHAARMYCGARISRNKEALTELAVLVDETYQPVLPGGDYPGDLGEMKKHWEYEINLHYNLVRLSKCKALVDAFSRTMRIGMFYRMNSFLPPTDRKEQLSHVELIDGLTVDNPDAAEKLIREHLQSGKRDLLKRFRGAK